MKSIKRGTPLISVVVPSYNQVNTVAGCVESLLNQNADFKYEIVIVDSSDNRTIDILKRFVPKIKLIHLNKKALPGKARNIGIKKTSGEIIAFTDTDCIVDKYWLKNIKAAHNKYRVAGGKIRNGNPFNLLGWGLFLTEFGEYINDRNQLVSNMPSCNISYKRTIFDKYGYFVEDYFPSEDYEFNSRIRERMLYSREIVVSHINRVNALNILKHAFRLGYTDSIVRRSANVEGKFLIKHKFLIPLLLFYRFFAVSYRAIRANRFTIFLVTSPFILLILLAWNIGFIKGVLNEN